MIEWGIAILIFLVMAVVVGRTLIDKPSVKKKEKMIVEQQAMPLQHMATIDPGVREQISRTEREVFRKADEVQRLADHDTEVIARLGPPVTMPMPMAPAPAAPETAETSERNPLEETAMLKSISQKAEHFRKMSEEEASS